MKPRQIIFEKVKGLKFTDGDTYVQLKYDGSQYHLHVKNLKPYALTSKRNSVKTGVLSEKLDHFPDLDYMDFTNETIIVVEVVAEHLDIPQNERCTKVASIMNSNIENIVHNDLRMVAHDFLYFEGTDVRTLPYSKRYELLHTCFPSAGWYGENIGVRNHTVYAVENIPLDEFYEGVDIPSVVDFQEYVNSDFFKWEGLVLKDSAEPMKMLKIKRIKTVDCFITGYTEGAGKYSGLVGSLKVGVWDKASIKEIATVSGFDDYLREEISAYKEDYLDHVLEVSYMEWTGSRLRHPRFKRLRDDKEHSKCTIDQLEE
jgi:ATP-dependent DNA ligase